MQMNRLVMTAGIAMASLISFADKVPTAAEMKKTQPLIGELMADDMTALKAKKKTPADVAETAVKYAEEAQTAATKYLLMRSAVQYFTRGEAYDRAADTVAKLKSVFPELKPDDVAEIIGKAARYATKKKAPRLFAMWEQATLQVKATKEAKVLSSQVKTKPSLRRKYAEALAASGDWKSALGEFAQLNDDGARLAKGELDGKAKDAALGEYWWQYRSQNEEYESVFKSHAAFFYRRAISSGEIAALQKTLIEKRIADYPPEEGGAAAGGGVVAKSAGTCVTNGKYDFVTGGDSPFRMSGDKLWLKLENGKELEFVKCNPGEVEIITDYTSNKKAKTKITRPYWIMRRVLTGGSVWNLGNGPKGANTCPRIKEDSGPAEFYFNTIDGFAGDVSEKVAKYMPKGYVMRLSSMAEFLNARDGQLLDMSACHIDKYLDRATPETVSINDKHYSQKINVTVDAEDFLLWSDDKSACRIGLAGDKRCFTLRDQRESLETWVGYHRYVIGPDLVSEWKAKHAGGAKSSVSAATSASASASAPSGKAWQEQGNTAWLTLKNGERIEFAKCPAGSFEMLTGFEDGNAKTTKVRITRPFWISKTAVGERVKEMVLDGHHREKTPVFSPFKFIVKENAFERFVGKLQYDFSTDLPSGYVFRLPSIAEYQYAYHANSKDPKDPYAQLDPSVISKETHKTMVNGIFGDSRSFGKTLKNKWGICDLVGSQYLLDRMSSGDCETCDKNLRMIRFLAKVEDSDPLFWGDDENFLRVHTLHGGRYSNLGLIDSKEEDNGIKWNQAHLVIGPDLVSEWKARNGKK